MIKDFKTEVKILKTYIPWDMHYLNQSKYRTDIEISIKDFPGISESMTLIGFGKTKEESKQNALNKLSKLNKRIAGLCEELI